MKKKSSKLKAALRVFRDNTRTAKTGYMVSNGNKGDDGSQLNNYVPYAVIHRELLKNPFNFIEEYREYTDLYKPWENYPNKCW